MARAMFEYTKIVLQKVSFDRILFQKELQKASSRLLPYELEELKVWLSNYLMNHPDLRNQYNQYMLS